MRPCRMHFDGDWQTLQGVNMAIYSLFVAIGLAIFMNKRRMLDQGELKEHAASP